MSQAASLPGAELFPENYVFFYKKPLVLGSFVAWRRTFSRKSIFLQEATCPGQLRCLGRNFFSEIRRVFEEATCPGQLRCLGAEFFSEKSDVFLKKQLVPGSFAAWGRTFFQKSDFFEDATCPWQLRCPGQNFFSEIRFF